VTAPLEAVLEGHAGAGREQVAQLADAVGDGDAINDHVVAEIELLLLAELGERLDEL